MKLAKRDGGYDDDDDDDGGYDDDDDDDDDDYASQYQLNQIRLLNADRASMTKPSAERLNKM